MTKLNPNEVLLVVTLNDGRQLYGSYDYMSAVQRIVEARKWDTFKGWEASGPAESLIEPLLLRQTGKTP